MSILLTIRNILLFLLMSGTFFSCAAEYETNQSSHLGINDISWESTITEVEEQLDVIQKVTDHDDKIGTVTALITKNLEVYGCPSSKCVFLSYNNNLFEIQCTFQSESLSDPAVLKNAISSHSGPPNITYTHNMFSPSDYFDGTKSLWEWILQDGTNIIVKELTSDGSVILTITYSPVYDALYERIENTP